MKIFQINYRKFIVAIKWAEALSVAEKSKIYAFQEEEYSGRNIVTKIGRSCNVVNSYLKDNENYGGRMKGKTFRATTERKKRLIIKEAFNDVISALKIANRVGGSASISTVRRVIKKCPYLRRRKIIKKTTPKCKASKTSFDICKRSDDLV